MAYTTNGARGSNGVDSRRRDGAYQTIKDGILSGLYGPNQRLSELDLSSELGVSRQTVDILRVREALEGVAASLAAQFVTAEEIDETGDMIDEMSSLDDPERLLG